MPTEPEKVQTPAKPAKKKYNYTKKTGRPAMTVQTMGLPDNWKEIIYEQSMKGVSEVGIRAHLCTLGGKFSDVTWDALKARDQEFVGTINKARVLCQAWWEEQGMKNLEHSKERVFETALWFINMKNRFGWRDKTEIEHDLSDSTIEVLSKLDPDALANHVTTLVGKNRVGHLLTP